MDPRIKNVLAVVAGLLAGSLINGGLINISGTIIPPPEGADVTTMEGLKASLHLFEPKHFIMPFLAHTLGTLVGAFVAIKLAASQPMRMAYIVAAFFFVGGAMNVMMLPAPMWFNSLDLVGAYFPMGWLALKLTNQQ